MDFTSPPAPTPLPRRWMCYLDNRTQKTLRRWLEKNPHKQLNDTHKHQSQTRCGVDRLIWTERNGEGHSMSRDDLWPLTEWPFKKTPNEKTRSWHLSRSTNNKTIRFFRSDRNIFKTNSWITILQKPKEYFSSDNILFYLFVWVSKFAFVGCIWEQLQ